VKTGDPNGSGLPTWLPAIPGAEAQVMHIDVETRLEPERHRGRYLLLDQIRKK
jgi:para-nitrobenzyl esterase